MNKIEKEACVAIKKGLDAYLIIEAYSEIYGKIDLHIDNEMLIKGIKRINELLYI